MIVTVLCNVNIIRSDMWAEIKCLISVQVDKIRNGDIRKEVNNESISNGIRTIFY